MEDSHFSHPEYQKQAERLMVRDFERILERESPMTRMKINLSFPGDKTPDTYGTKDLSPEGPLAIYVDVRYLVIQANHMFKILVLSIQKKLLLSFRNQGQHQHQQQQQQKKPWAQKHQWKKYAEEKEK